MKAIILCFLFATLIFDIGTGSSIGKSRVRRIIGGAPISIEDAPHFVYLLDKSYTFRCAGSLITMRHVLTTRHCIDVERFNKEVALKYVIAGVSSLDNIKNERVIQNVYEPKESYNWNFIRKSSKPALSNIAILELNEPFEESSKIKPVKLPTQPVQIKDTAILYGYGAEEPDFDRLSNQLKALHVKIGKCFGDWHIFLDEFCTKSNPTESFCDRDGGDGLINKDGEIIGMASRNNRCGRNMVPNIYSDIYYHLEAIKSIINGTMEVTKRKTLSGYPTKLVY